MFQSGFHRLAFFFTVAACIAWFFILRSWTNTLVAAILCIPIGVVFSFLPSMLTGFLRQLPFLNDAVLTWVPLLGGISLGAYGLTFHGATGVLIVLCGAALVFAGVSLLLLRLMAMRIRRGEATQQDADFVDDLYNVSR